MITPLGTCGGVQEMDILNKHEIDDVMTTGPGSEMHKCCIEHKPTKTKQTHNIQPFEW